MRRTTTIGAAALAAGTLALTGASATATAGPTRATTGAATATAVGLSTDGLTLSTFPLSAPAQVATVGTVTGLDGDTFLIGIDQRIQDRRLYGVGNAGGVYTLDPATASATKVNTLSVALSGTRFGVDFNPAADRLRIVSDTGQNLRHNVNPGGTTLVDLGLTYAPGSGTTATGVTGAGYTNNDLDTRTGTALLDLDTTLDQVVLQVPANDGTLTSTGTFGFDAMAVTGFDVRTTTKDGRTTGNTGYAALRKTGNANSALFTVDLLSGNLTRVGFFSGVNVADIAVVQP